MADGDTREMEIESEIGQDGKRGLLLIANYPTRQLHIII